MTAQETIQTQATKCKEQLSAENNSCRRTNQYTEQNMTQTKYLMMPSWSRDIMSIRAAISAVLSFAKKLSATVRS